MIPDRPTATLILLAILGAMLVLAVPAIWLVRWLARGGKHLDGLGPIGEQPCAACDWPEACRLGDDTAAMLCARCAGNPDARCTCPADCGRRYCTWATSVSDARFTAELAEMLRREGGQ